MRLKISLAENILMICQLSNITAWNRLNIPQHLIKISEKA
jgi:hypothetical protein